MGKLTVVCEGTLGIVPSKPVFKKDNCGDWISEDKVDWMAVVLPDLTSPAIASWGIKEIPALRAHHVPALAFPMDLLVESKTSREIDLVVRISRRNYLGVILLRFEHVTFGNQISGSQGVSVASKVYDGKEVPGSQEESRSLWWVPRMVELQGSYSLVDRTYNPNEKNDLPGTRVRGTALFSRGNLQVTGFNLDSQNKFRPWLFGKVEAVYDQNRWVYDYTKDFSRAIGNRLELQADLDGRTLDINFRERSVVKRLRLKGSLCERAIDISILNVEPEVATSLSGSAFHGFGEMNPGDADFDALYGLPLVRADSAVVPIDVNNGAADLGRPCAPVLFNGFTRQR